MATDPLSTYLKELANDDSQLVRDLPWSNEIKADRYAEALPIIEQSLVQNPECPTGKLWWVRCQAMLQQLPISALTAPLEELTPTLEHAENHLQQLACSTFLQSALLLENRKQFRLSITMLEHSAHFANLCRLEPRTRSALYDHYLNKLKDEIAQAPLRRESKDYLNALEQRLIEAKANKNNIPESTNITNLESSDKQRGNGRLSSKAILQAASQAEQGAASRASPLSLEQTTNSNRKNAAVILIICLLATIAGVYLFSPEALTPAENLAINLHAPIMAQPITPELSIDTEQLESPQLDAGSQLAGVGNRVKQIGSDPSGEQEGSSASQPSDLQSAGEVSDDSTEIDLDATNPTNAPKLSGPRPIDDDQLVSLSGVPVTTNQIDANNVPKIDPERFATTKVEDVGTSPRKAPAPSNSKNPDNQPANSRNDSSSDPKKALDGSILKGYEVQQYDPPIVFHTVTSTNVLARPSFLAPSLARLESNTPIHVTRKMGLWLELRSTEGRTGYIYAQDAANRR